MKVRQRTILILMMPVYAALAAVAQTDSLPTLRAVTSAYTLEYGSAQLADTYLSPLRYEGWHGALRYERTQPMRLDPQRWIMQLRLGVVFDDAESPARNTDMLNGSLEASWTMMRRWQMPEGLTLGVGAGPSLSLGAMYLSRNGNNPASVKAAMTIDATAYGAWHHRFGRLDMTLRYQPTLPIAGVFFAPDYGQLYYQIYMGDNKGLAHAAWWGDYFAMDNLLVADLHLGNTSLRVGYHNTILSTKVNHIVTRDITHAIVLGVSTQWISLRPDSRSIDARIVSAY